MELRNLVWLLLCACACAPQSKRLVIPEDMRKVTAGPAAAESEPPSRPHLEYIEVSDPFARGEPKMTAPDEKAEKPLTVVADLPPPGAPASKAVRAAAAGRAPKAAPPPPQPLRTPATSPTPREQRYVLRLVEHGRVWEVELPEDSGGYEVRIPLGPPIEQPTLADQELLGKEPKEVPAKSYLTSLARIAEMYSAHRYELALIELVELEQQYPKDSRVAAMKGSLYHRLGKPRLAREAWKKALEIDPTNAEVAQALGTLKEE